MAQTVPFERAREEIDRAIIDVIKFYRTCSVLYLDTFTAVQGPDNKPVPKEIIARISFLHELSAAQLNELIRLLNNIEHRGLIAELTYSPQEGIIMGIVWSERFIPVKESVSKPAESPKPAPVSRSIPPPVPKKKPIEPVRAPAPATRLKPRPLPEPEPEPLGDEEEETEEEFNEELEQYTDDIVPKTKTRKEAFPPLEPSTYNAEEVRQDLEKMASLRKPVAKSSAKVSSPLDDIFDDLVDEAEKIDGKV